MNGHIVLLQKMDQSTKRRVQIIAGYVGFFVIFGAIVPYWPTFLHHKHFSPIQIGWMLSILPLAQLLAPSIWRKLLKGSGARARWIRRCALGVLLSAPCLFIWHLPLSLYVPLAVLYAFSSSGFLILNDARAFSVLANAPHRYGYLRVWGSLSFALTSWFLGRYGGAASPQIIFFVAVFGGLVGLISVVSKFDAQDESAQPEPSLTSPSAGAAWWPLVLPLALYYAGHAIYDGYIGLRIEALHFDSAVLGELWTIGVGSEIALLFIVPRILSRFHPGHCLFFVALIAALRWYLVATVQTAPALIAIQSLHGITFGLWYASAQGLAQRCMGKERREWGASLITSSIGSGRLLGLHAGGFLIEAFGTAPAFFVATFCALCASGLHLRFSLPQKAVS